MLSPSSSLVMLNAASCAIARLSSGPVEEEEEEDMIPDENESFVSAMSLLDRLELDSGHEDLRHIFQTFDANGDGKLSKEELSSSLHNLGLSIPEHDLVAMLHAADLNYDGFVDFSEFVTLYYTLCEHGDGGGDGGGDGKEGDAELREAFDVFDKNGDGFISAQELQSVLSSLGLKQGKRLLDCQNMIREVDADGDGLVNFEEFRQMMFVKHSLS